MNQIKWKKTKTSSWLQCFTAIEWTKTFRAQKQFQFWNYRFLRATHKLIAGSRNKVKRSNFITGNAKHAKRSWKTVESRLIYYRLEIDDAVKVVKNVLQKSAILKVARSSCHCSFTGLWTQREGNEQSNGISREKKKREIATVIRKLGFGGEAERKRREREWVRESVGVAMQNEGGKGLRELFWGDGREGSDAAKTSFLSPVARGGNDPIRIFSSFLIKNTIWASMAIPSPPL